MAEMSSEKWMVRTIENEIKGPFTRDELIDQIKGGQLNHQDEVCRGNHYWIYLDERDEVLAQLGLDIPRASSSASEEESTDTETDTITQDISVAFKSAEQSMTSQNNLSSEMGSGSTQSPSLAMRARPAPRYSTQIRAFPDAQSKPLVLGGLERPSFWRFILSMLFICASILVAWVIRVLQAAR